jgi:hypothetical protein
MTTATQKMDRNDKRALLARFKAPSDLPLRVSGIVAEVVRPPLAGWIVAGQVPESLFAAATSAVQSGQVATVEALSMPEMFGLALKLARASFKWPRLTEEGKEASDEDELDPACLPLEDLSTILAWGVGGGDDAGMIQTTSGEVSAKALGSFRQDADVSGSGDGLRDVRETSGAGVGDS